MSVLCSMVGASFAVAAAAEVIRLKKSIIAVGNAQIDTAQSKFGGSSAYFDGNEANDSHLQISPVNQLRFGTNNFTIEFWYRPTGRNVQFPLLFGNQPGYANGSIVIHDRHQSYSTVLSVFCQQLGGITLTSTTTTSNSTWYHVAVVRDGATLRLFINGTQESTFNASTNNIDSNATGTISVIGGDSFADNDYYGHIDEIRISNSARYTANFTPATTPFVNDANTLFLMHANGTNAATFFEDDNGVRSKKGITAVATAQVSTAQSKFGGSSALFDGTGDYLQIAANSDFDLGTTNKTWTIEGWMYLSSLPSAYKGIISCQDGSTTSGGGFDGWGVYIDNNNRLTFIANASSATYNSTTGAFTTGSWIHWAVVRSTSTLKMFVGGTETYSTTGYVDRADNDKELLIGRAYNISSGYNGALDLNGYLDEIRISNTARYTANFTPSTTAFVNDANTQLLIHADGTNNSTVFRDDNGALGSNWTGRTQRTVTAFGNAQIDTAQSQFGGSSALFDGNGDYLTVANPGFNWGTGDFTAEAWVRHAAINDQQVYWDFRSTGTNHHLLYIKSNNTLEYFDGQTHTSTTTLAANTWYHLALSRSSGTLRLFINGVQEYSVSNSGNHDNTATAFIATTFDGNAANSVNGHIDEIRISNIARYTAGFTPSSTAFVNDANTLFLLHFNGADASTTFTDDIGTGRTQKGIQAIGNAQIDTAQSKFGGSSYLGDGTGDYLDIKSSGSISLSNSYTIECWYRVVDVSAALIPLFDISSHLFYIGSSGANYFVFRKSTSTNLFASSTLSLSNNTWYHVAWVRNGTSFKTFHNGVEVQTNNSYGETMTVNDTTTFIGRYTASWHLNGHIDEFRISNTARYTANFTPSTTPFQNDTNTLLLLHMDGTDASTVFTDDNGVPPDYEY